jgi:lipopolysaccharide export system permease protein
MIKILHWMIFWELLKVFILALVALTGLFLLAGLVQEAAQRGLSPGQIVSILPLLIPSTLPYTVPATTLFATCVVYGRLSADNEVTAMRAAGLNLWVALQPAVWLGLLTSAATFGLYYHVIPYTHQLLQVQIMNEGEEVLYAKLKKDRCLKAAKLPYVVYVREVQGRRLIDVILKKKKPHPTAGIETYNGYDVVARAREAELRIDRTTNVLKADMTSCVVWGDSEVAGFVKNKIFEMPLPESMFGGDAKNRPGDLTWTQILDRQAEVADEIVTSREKVEAARARLKATPIPLQTQLAEFASLDCQAKAAVNLARGLEAELNLRPALALGCLCFVLVGCPVGIWASRADYLSSFVICFLPTIMVYYPLLLAGTNLGKDGTVPLPVGVWMANVIVGLIALGLVVRLVRR